MQPKAFVFTLLTIVLVTVASWFGARWAVGMFEQDTTTRVNASLNAAGQNWASVETDGLIVGLTGEAPSESARFRALEVTARIVDTNRINDETTIRANASERLPDFSLEILRSDEELSLIGLVPGKEARIEVLGLVDRFRSNPGFTDLLESVEFDPPEGWEDAVAFAVTITNKLARSHITVRPGGVTAEAFFEDVRAAKEAREAINAEKPQGLALRMDFSAPRAIVAPFRFVATKTGGQFEVLECWSDSENAKAAIYSALSDISVDADCPEALGAPTPEWASGVIAAVNALSPVQDAKIAITDIDITLTGTEDTDLEAFETARITLEATLPDIFSLRWETPGHVAAPEPRSLTEPIFSASYTASEGLRLSGPMRDTVAKTATEGIAAAKFADAPMALDLSVSPNIPSGWSPRVLAALEALSLLHDGSVEMTMSRLNISGRSAQDGVERVLRENLAQRLEGTELNLEIEHDPALASVISQADVDARECERQLAGILREAQIVFDPNSSTISGESEILLDEIAFIIKSCPEARFQIGGHTDSQGREEMNLALSQSRADAVLDALLGREVLLAQLSSKGFGESEPIADNETEDGRARNRRIAFKLIATNEGENEQN